jgi:hypothetical protein
MLMGFDHAVTIAHVAIGFSHAPVPILAMIVPALLADTFIRKVVPSFGATSTMEVTVFPPAVPVRETDHVVKLHVWIGSENTAVKNIGTVDDGSI